MTETAAQAHSSAKSYWFYIETYVHISQKKESLLLYNTYTGAALEYHGPQHRDIFKLIRRMKKPANLWMVRLREKDLRHPLVSRFVQAVRDLFMGDLLDTAFSQGKPVQTVPMVTIQKRSERLKKETGRSVGEGMMSYLTEIFLYVNSRCGLGCTACDAAFRQFPCCTARQGGEADLGIAEIEQLVNELAGSSLVNINILGGDLIAYKDFDRLADILDSHPARKTFYCHYLNLTKGKLRFRLPRPGSAVLKIPVTFPIDGEKLKAAREIAKSSGLPAGVVFIVQSESDILQAEAVIAAQQIEDYEVRPFYNGENLEFFQQNVYLEKEDILASRPSLKDIYRNSEVNELDFGRLFVFANGFIHTGANAPRLGILGKDSLYHILYKEMYRGRVWRRVRKNVAPCKSCILAALCPPLSAYTYALGRNDLCFKALPGPVQESENQRRGREGKQPEDEGKNPGSEGKNP